MGAALAETPLPNGGLLVELEGCGGETDFYRVFDLVNERLSPETSRTSVDSLCVMGTFRKDGIPVRMSSEGINDWVSFQYDDDALSEADREKVKGWLRTLAEALEIQ